MTHPTSNPTIQGDRTSLTNLNTLISDFSSILRSPIGQKVDVVNMQGGPDLLQYPVGAVKSQSGIKSDYREYPPTRASQKHDIHLNQIGK